MSRGRALAYSWFGGLPSKTYGTGRFAREVLGNRNTGGSEEDGRLHCDTWVDARTAYRTTEVVGWSAIKTVAASNINDRGIAMVENGDAILGNWRGAAEQGGECP